jgi:hypothetical protein
MAVPPVPPQLPGVWGPDVARMLEDYLVELTHAWLNENVTPGTTVGLEMWDHRIRILDEGPQNGNAGAQGPPGPATMLDWGSVDDNRSEADIFFLGGCCTGGGSDITIENPYSVNWNGTVNNFVFPPGTYLQANVNGPTYLTGIKGTGQDGQYVEVQNVGNSVLYLQQNNASSGLGNAIYTPANSNYPVLPNAFTALKYNKAANGFLPVIFPGGVGNYLDYYRGIGGGNANTEPWYASGNGDGGNFGTLTGAGYLYANYFTVPQTITLDRIAIVNQGTGSSSEKIRLGIYQSTSESNIYPSKLILDAGEIVLTSTGTLSITINKTLTPGLYYLASVYNTASTSVVFAMIQFGMPALLVNPSGSGSNQSGFGFYKAMAYGALPDPFPAEDVNSFINYLTAHGTPWVVVRRSA